MAGGDFNYLLDSQVRALRGRAKASGLDLAIRDIEGDWVGFIDSTVKAFAHDQYYFSVVQVADEDYGPAHVLMRPRKGDGPYHVLCHPGTDVLTDKRHRIGWEEVLSTFDGWLAAVRREENPAATFTSSEQARDKVQERVARSVHRVFLSHSSDDREIAAVLKTALERGKRGLSVFVSSYPGDIPASRAWLDKIREELDRAEAYLALLTPSSIDRTWVWFESGAAWKSGSKWINALARGMAASDVPAPLSTIQQVYSLEIADEAAAIFRDLGAALPDVEQFCESVRTSGGGPRAVFRGVELGGAFFAWDGPLTPLPDWSQIPTPGGLLEALKSAGCTPHYGRLERLTNHLGEGLKQVFATDRKTFKRAVLGSGSATEQILLVRPPTDTS